MRRLNVMIAGIVIAVLALRASAQPPTFAPYYSPATPVPATPAGTDSPEALVANADTSTLTSPAAMKLRSQVRQDEIAEPLSASTVRGAAVSRGAPARRSTATTATTARRAAATANFTSRTKWASKAQDSFSSGKRPVKAVNAEDDVLGAEPAAVQAYATQGGESTNETSAEPTVGTEGSAAVDITASSELVGARANGAENATAEAIPPSVAPPTVSPDATPDGPVDAPVDAPVDGAAVPDATQPSLNVTDNDGADSIGPVTIGTGVINPRSAAAASGTIGPLPRPPRDAAGGPVVRLSQRPAIGFDDDSASPSDRLVPGFAGPPAPAANEPPGSSYLDLDSYLDDGRGAYDGEWTWQLLPSSLIYKSYLAGLKESRLASQHVNISGDGWLWDAVLGGRVGLLRYGDRDPVLPNGWQIDAEGSAQVRLDITNDVNVRAVDFRGGLPITYGAGRFRTKFGYYHLSSHLGDEFLLENPGYPRLNYSRDCFVLGETFFITERLRIYGEMAWAFHSDVAKPWEFQFGVDYAPIAPTGFSGEPFFAANGHIRQELDYSGHFTLQTGWAWVSDENGRLLRVGFQYVNGMSTQYSFYSQFEQQVGMGLWYDY